MEIIVGIIGVILGAAASVVALRNRKMIDLDKSQAKAQKLLEEAKAESENILSGMEERIESVKTRAQEDQQQREELLAKMESGAELKEASIEKRESRLNEIKLMLAGYEEELQVLEEKNQETEAKVTQKLLEISRQDPIKIKEELIATLQKELEHEKGEKLQFLEEYMKEQAPKEAEKIIVNAIQRLSSATSVERRMVNIKVSKDKAKGKIVGKQGVNIRYFEAKLGIDVVFNDQPNTISVSAFNLVNRRIAEVALNHLINEKRDITESVIDEAITKATKTTDDELLLIGKKSAEKIGIKNTDDGLLKIIGRLQYRTSYGQNIMLHSLEVGWLAIMLGAEIGLNIETLKLGGFLHDLGKAIDQNPDVQGTHDYLTKEIMEKYNFSWEEVHAAWTHHDSQPPETPEAMIVKAADAISASRPGARQESLDKYIQRLKDLEGTAGSFAGVKKAFAISAGREVRVIVDPEDMNDLGVQALATKIAKQVQQDVTYPGKVKINVIRRIKCVDTAK